MASALALTLMSGFAVSATPFVLDGPGAVPANAAATRLLASPAESGSAFYTVLLREAPLATYAGEIAGLAAPERLLRGSSGGKLDMESAAAVAYVNHLSSRQEAFVANLGASVGRSINVRARMQHALNAVIVELTSSEAAALSQNPDVLVVEREHQLHLDTDNAPTFTGAPSIWDGNTSSGAATKGEGIVVGVVDTGINWQSPAYAAVGPIDGYVHLNPRGTGNYLGLCGATPPNADLGRCNDKLIGMYNFAETTATRSGQDTQGHGSHTSSTVAGNRWAATFASGPFTISGVAPHANIISYLACPSTCPSTATSQSVNQAVIDGVDVLNYSISGGTTPWTDTTSIAFRNANAAGMFVATSAGNTSTTVPDPQGQVNHMEPWVETVAASTQNRVIAVTFDLDGGPANTQDVPMRTGAPPLPTSNLVGRPVIKSPGFANGATDACTAFPANTFTGPYSVPAEDIFKNGFDEPVAPPTTVGGIAVLRLDPATSACGSGVRRTNAINAGAAGVIFVDAAYINLGAADTSWSMLLSNWNTVEAALVPGTSTGSVDIAARSFPAQGDLVAGFSFRGPRLVGGQGMVKPDITAPGVDILAVGAANVVGPNGVYLNNGTSMSSPHMAGAAALMRALNPSWTPPQIKSALNLSSNNFGAANQDGSAIRLWDYGSGRVNLTSAAKVGLIMDETAANFLAANPATGGDIASLNLASMAKYNFTGSTTFTRTFRRAKAGSQTYTLGLAGLPAGAATFSPASFSINSSGSRSVTVTVNSALLPEAAWALGELILTPAGGDEPTLHLPIAVYPGGPQIAVSPSSLSGTSDTTVTSNLTISNTANPTLNWQFQTTGTAVVTPFNTGVTSNGQQGGLYSGPPARGYHWAQNFDVAGPMKVTTLRANGFTLPAAATLTTANTTGVTFSIYADNAGNPAGATEGFGALPLWTYTATIGTANGITTTAGAISLNLNATNVVSNPLNLPAGRYWLSVSPRINGTGAQTTANPLWAWYVSDAPLVGSVPKLYAPWSDPTAFSTAAGLNTLAGFVQGTVDCTKPTWVDLTTLSGSLGLAGSQSVPVTFNAAGLSAGTYNGSLCVTSNATNAPVVSVPLTFTVPNGGSQAPTISKAFAPASVSTAGTSALTITLSNAGPTASTLSAPLLDTFPSGLVVAATPAAATTCPSGVVTAVAGAGSVSLGAGAQIPATGSCTVSVSVSSATAGSYVNTIAAGALQTSSGNNAAPATATLGVTVVTYTVTPSVNGGNGTIAPATPQVVNSGATPAFNLTPSSGYQIGSVTGTCGGSLSGSTFTTAAVIADCTVIANFTLIPPAQCAAGNTVEVTATGGTTGPTNYTTLKGAFDAINAGTHTGVLDVAICGDTTETASAVLNATGSGSALYTAALIKPAGGAARTVSGSLAAPLIDFNGADNVTIDGINSGGNALTLSNTSTAATPGTSTIRFTEGAMTNVVTKTSVRGSSTGAVTVATGTILFNTSTVAGGNSGNTVLDNNIGAAGVDLPSKAVTLLGSATPLHNVGNTIIGNRISDFFSPTVTTAGINVQANNDTTTVSDNRIFQTAARTFTGAAGVRYTGILVNSATFTTNVIGNVIGFGAADGTGTTTITGTGTGLGNEIRGIIFTNARTTAPLSVISGNTVSGFNQTTNRAVTTVGANTADSASFVGIHSGSAADAPANITGNTVGSLDGSSTIVVNAGSVTANTQPVTGILDYNFVGGVSIASNNIGAITVNSNSGVGSTTSLRGIFVSSTTGVLHSVTDNVIGGPTAAGGIVNNLVGSNSAFGINVVAANGTVTGNTVRNISGNANNGAVVMSGIFMSGSTAANPTIVARNTVHSLRNSSSTGAAGATYTIDLALAANAGNVVERNLIHSITANSTFTAYQIVGLYMRNTGGSTTAVRNNMVRLGFDPAGVAMTTPYSITGIRDAAATGAANNFYNNSVYIGGSNVISPGSNTVAFTSDTITTPRLIQNNIFWNARSNVTAGGTAHAAIRLAGTAPNPAGTTSNYNDLLASGNDGVTGIFNLAVVPTLAAWRTTTGQDANSFAIDPQYIAPAGTAVTGDLHISPTIATPVEGTGLLVASVTDDFDGDVRAGLTPTDIGADAGNFVALPQVTVTPSVTGGNGTISPATVQSLFSGGSASFTLTPDAGFQIGPVTGSCGGTLTGSVYTTAAVTANCTVIASFTSSGFTVTPSVSGGNGSISPNTPQTVASGATTAFTLTPNAGFAIGPVTGTCPAGSQSGGIYTTGAITANCTVIASFTQITYTVNPSAGANGSISPNTAQTVNSGATTAFTLTPAANYQIGPVSGTCPAGSLSGGTYTTGAITADCTVIASFTPITYTVTPSAGANGSISPNTPQTVNSGASQAFTLTPNAGFAIGPVSGTCPTGTLSGGVYTTGAIVANCTVIASFTQITYTVTPSAGANGSISPSTPQTVNSGATTAFTLTPDAGFAIGPVTGTCPNGPVSAGVYTTGPIVANCTVIASFIQITYTVTPSVGTGPASGTITPNTPQTVNSGATTAFTLAPASGYSIGTVTGTCGGNLSGTTFTTAAATDNCTVIANFTLITYTVTPTVTGSGGTISPATPQTVNSGATTIFTVSADPGFQINTVVGCGGTLTGNSFTTDVVTANCTVTASFTALTFPAPYCARSFGTAEPLTRVQLFGNGGFNNVTPAALAGALQLENFTATTGAVAPGAAYPIRVEGNSDGNFANAYAAYIDWDRSGTFEASESYFLGTIVNSTGIDGKNVTGTIAVPAGASLGNTRMRVVKRFTSAAAPTLADAVACGVETGQFGQAEDYTINVSPTNPPPPPIVSKAFAPTNGAAGADTTLTVTLGNGGAAASTSTADFVDTLPTGLLVAATPAISSTCVGTVTATPSTNTVTLASGASIPPGGCTISVNVNAAAGGIFVNTIAAGGFQTSVGSNAAAASATYQAIQSGVVAYRTGFESPFTVAALNAQQGWSARVTNVATTTPANGTQHLSQSALASPTATTNPLAISPTIAPGTAQFATVAANLRITRTTNGATWRFNPQDPAAGLLTSIIQFERSASQKIQIATFDAAGAGTIIDTGATWPAATYFNFKVIVERSTGALRLCVNGAQVYENLVGNATTAGRNISNVAISQFVVTGNTAANTLFADDLVIDYTNTGTCGP